MPVITGIYDPLSKKCDGTVTSQAPVIVSGRYLDMLGFGKIKLCLVPATDDGRVIEVMQIYKLSHHRVIASLPFLVPGEYFPAVRIAKKGYEDWVYIFPVSWVVLPE